MKMLLKINTTLRWNNNLLQSIDIHINPFAGSFENDLFSLDNTPYVPQKGDRFYFLPDVNIPRIKLKDLATNYGIKVTRDPENATHIFASKNTINKVTTRNWYYKIPTSYFKEYVEEYKSYIDEQHVENVRQALEFYTEEYVICEHSTRVDLTDEDLPNFSNLSIIHDDETVNSQRVYMLDKDYVNLFDEIKGKTITDEVHLLDILNGDDAVVIDATTFDQLSNLFKSSDTDNHVLAMEIMANSKYKESMLYLGILFKEFQNVMNNQSTKNHVNFKSLLTYFNIRSLNYDTIDLDFIVERLKTRNVLTTDMLNVLLDKYNEEVIGRNTTRAFQVKTVTVNPELLGILNTNYMYETAVDFTPVVNVIKPIEEVIAQEPEVIEEPVSEFAAEDNFETSDDELVASIESVEIQESEEEVITPETEVFTNQTNITTNDSDIDWF
jgi:hypothetical protein